MSFQLNLFCITIKLRSCKIKNISLMTPFIRNPEENLQFQPDLAHWRTHANCIHLKDNLPKPVNYRLAFKEGPKAKSDHVRRLTAHDFLLVGVTLKTSRTNNKQVIGTFKFRSHHLTLKERPKVKSDHITRLLAHDFP